MSLPFLVVASDSAPIVDGVGSERTLYNLFRTWPLDRLRIYGRGTWSSRPRASAPLDGVFSVFNAAFLPSLLFNRGWVPRSWVDAANLRLFRASGPHLARRIRAGGPSLAVVSPIHPEGVYLGCALIRSGLPVVAYFMDDWLEKADPAVASAAGRLLRDAAGWMMISERLQETLAARYGLQPARTLVVHNPVVLGPLPPAPRAISNRPFRLLYAGAIWPMHRDALERTARAVARLRQEGVAIELIVFTQPRFWDGRSGVLAETGTLAGGFRHPDELPAEYAQADLLLVVSSFAPEQEPMTRSSVQTKLTDYMTSDRPVLSVGPAYSACHDFVRRWQVGHCCSGDEAALAEFLRERVAARAAEAELGRNGRRVLAEHFTAEVVVPRLQAFLASCAPAA